ncbi:hypothetical protein RIR_jg12015.t1 [Rhizophagus irregularis DAOM 181602=DAOM 197198]|nr:hypothetical protein RIR_jg12015.t1 [Rhizophagus irregularis DAOM 181602=DAOM 197198]
MWQRHIKKVSEKVHTSKYKYVERLHNEKFRNRHTNHLMQMVLSDDTKQLLRTSYDDGSFINLPRYLIVINILP